MPSMCVQIASKGAKVGQKGSKRPQIGSKWPKMGSKCVKTATNVAQRGQNWSKSLKMRTTCALRCPYFLLSLLVPLGQAPPESPARPSAASGLASLREGVPFGGPFWGSPLGGPFWGSSLGAPLWEGTRRRSPLVGPSWGHLWRGLSGADHLQAARTGWPRLDLRASA